MKIENLIEKLQEIVKNYPDYQVRISCCDSTCEEYSNIMNDVSGIMVEEVSKTIVIYGIGENLFTKI